MSAYELHTCVGYCMGVGEEHIVYLHTIVGYSRKVNDLRVEHRIQEV